MLPTLLLLLSLTSLVPPGDSQVTAGSVQGDRVKLADTPYANTLKRQLGADPAVQRAKLRPMPEGIAGLGGGLGDSISLSGNRALVGGRNLADSGAAVVFEKSGDEWIETAVLRPSDGAPDDEFALSVSLSGDRALVGAWSHDANGRDSGSAYVFDFDGFRWRQTAKLTPSDNAANDEFGRSVSLVGDRALIGAHLDDDQNVDSGSAYVYQFDGSTWIETAKLTASDGTFWDKFGYSVSLSDDRALVGASDDDGAAGAAYVFDFDGLDWIESAKLTADDGTDLDRLGWSVCLSGDRAVVGALSGDGVATDTGAAYVFELNQSNWSQVAKLTASDGARFDRFGRSVGIQGDIAMIGSLGDGNEPSSGAVYLFEFDGAKWWETRKIFAGDGQRFDSFGAAISIAATRALVGAPGAGSGYVIDRVGVDWVETARISAREGAERDEFGSSTSLSGRRALIGAYGDDDNGSAAGAAYVFDFFGSSEHPTAKLTPSEGGLGEGFGTAVGLSGDRALIGAPGWLDPGSAYVFEWIESGWIETARITPNDADTQIHFGVSADLEADRALIGANTDRDNGNGAGAAYMYEFDGENWTLIQKLTASDGDLNDRFGSSVSLSGDRALVGAEGDEDNGPSSGSAYVFEFDGAAWNEVAKLLASDGDDADNFGLSVSLSGDRALVGAYGDDDNGNAAGAAYVFEFDGSTWTETAKLTGSETGPLGFFGRSVSLSSNRAVIGASGDDANGPRSGSAYVFDFDGTNWIEIGKLVAADAAAEETFGGSVSVSDEFVLTGAPLDDDRGTDSGSAYVWDFGLIFADGFETD